MGNAATSNWEYTVTSPINRFELTVSGNSTIIAQQRPGETVQVNTNMPAEYRQRISFQVDETAKIMTFVLKDIIKTDDAKSFTMKVDTDTNVLNFYTVLKIVGE